MNIGDCPYSECDGVTMVEVGENAGKVVRHKCPECGREIATMLSRFDSWSMTWDEFVEEYLDASRTK